MDGSSARPTTEALLAHVEWVRRLARLLVANVHDADDVEQETWRQALERPPRSSYSLRKWFAAVARNVARKRVRAQEVRERNEREAAVNAPALGSSSTSAAAGAAHDVTARAELHRRVVDAVLSLEELYRTPLLLRFFDDLPAAEVAQRLAVPVETARTRIKRGLALLRARLGAEFGSDGRAGIAALLPLVTGGGKGAAAVATAAAGGSGMATLAGGGLVGLVVGGAFMSKLAKVAVGVVVAGLAGFGTYKVWLEPRRDREPGMKSAAKPIENPPPEFAPPPPATAPAPAAAAATRETAERAAPIEKPTPAAALATIDGVVLDASARPVAGARVVLDRRTNSWIGDVRTFRTSLHSFDQVPKERRTFTVAKSGADGSFRFDDVDPGNAWAIGAVHDPLGTGWTDQIVFSGTPASARVVVTLEAGVVIFGVVRDPAGKPVEAANILIDGAKRPRDDDRFILFGEFADGINTAEDGSYRSTPLPWRFVHFHVLAWGRPELAQLETKFEELPQGVTGFRRDLTVETMTTLRGRVVTADGQPAHLLQSVVPRLGDDATRVQSRETIAVAAFADDPRRKADSIQALGRNNPGTIYLDADHVYGTLALAEDRYEIPLRSAQLRFIALIARDRILGVAEIPTPPSAPDLIVDLALLPQQSLLHALRLHVRSARDHAPLDGARVYGVAITRWSNGGLGMEILHWGEEEGPADRELELPRMPCSIFVRREGCATRMFLIDASRVGAPSEATVELEPAAGPLRVRVVDAGGAPLSGARPRFYRAAGHEPATNDDEKSTDEHGEATYAGLAAGELQVVMEKPDFAAAAVSVTIGDDESEAEIVLERGYEVTIHARAVDGSAAPYGQLSITNEAGVPLYDHFRGDSGPVRLSGTKVRLTDGTYTVRCLIPGGDGATQKFVAAPGAVIDVALAPVR